MTWQDTSTAPKDGTRILGWVTKAEWDVGDDVISMRETWRPFAAEVYYTGLEAHAPWEVVEAFGWHVTCEISHWQHHGS